MLGTITSFNALRRHGIIRSESGVDGLFFRTSDVVSGMHELIVGAQVTFDFMEPHNARHVKVVARSERVPDPATRRD